MSIASLIGLTLAPAATLYWDSNSTTAGAGTTPSGTWGVSTFWSTDSTGNSATANTTTTVLDTLTFSAGTDGIGSPTVTVSGTQNAQTLSIEEGTFTVEVLYGDYEGGQRVISRYGIRREPDGAWHTSTGLHHQLDRVDPRPRDG